MILYDLIIKVIIEKVNVKIEKTYKIYCEKTIKTYKMLKRNGFRMLRSFG